MAELINSITPQASCEDEFDPAALTVDAARARILDAVHVLTETEHVDLPAALDRVLALEIIAPVNVPAHTNSAMDGYALRGVDLPASGSTATLNIIGSAFAGKPYNAAVSAGNCVRIMTGAVMPDGTDTVAIQEQVERNGNTIKLDSRHRTGDNVRAAGEDIRADSTVFSAGRRLTPADLGVLASLGIGTVKVFRRLRVAYFSTGDELQPIGQQLTGGEIHDSNRYTLAGMLARLGCELIDLGIVRDTRDATRAAFTRAANGADVIISSGGVSVGEADYVKEILRELGSAEFWKVAMKPGRPLTFGRVQHAAFFGLPGNPVSVMVTFYQFVQPALRKMMGEHAAPPVLLKAVSRSKLKKRAGRVEFQRAVLTREADGTLAVSKTGMQGSGILSSMSASNCFVVLPMDSTGAQPGDTVDVELFNSLL